jgi:hypothetical protein
MSADDFEDDDWIDLEKQTPGAAAQMPDVTVSLNVWATRHKSKTQPKVRASICLRRGAAAWIESHGPRFKVQIGGKSCNLIRIVPDAERGQFEAAALRGVQRLSIGVVNIWPNEIRLKVEAKWSASAAGLVITLPDGFAKAGQGETPVFDAPPASQSCEQQQASKAPAFPVTTAARGLEKIAKAADQGRRRDVSSSLMGDPPPARSALSQRGGRDG